ncbi:hypothetical protein FACS18949_16980 [Clostridia bacterium]|nr:hypothetical protein FACS18949_16980 [Clostridia bacterium]
MSQKLIEANRRFDEALNSYMRVATTEENARELKRAGENLNKAIDAAEAAEKEKNETLVEKLKVDLIMSAGRVNSDAERKDIPRNHTNYGIVTKCADVLRLLGQEVEIPCYGDGEYLKIPKAVINGKETAYHNG